MQMNKWNQTNNRSALLSFDSDGGIWPRIWRAWTRGDGASIKGLDQLGNPLWLPWGPTLHEL